MKYVYTLTATLLLGVLMVGCNKTPQEKADWMVKKVTKKLDLNEVQNKKLVTLKDALLEVRGRRMQERSNMHASAKDLLLSNKLDEGKIRDLITDRHKVVDQEFPRIFPLIQDFHNSLSLGQKEKLVSVLEKFQKKHGHGWRK